MKRSVALALAAAGVGTGLSAQDACAQLAIGGGVGTTGGKIEAEYQVANGVVLRGGYNYFKYSRDDSQYDDITYDGDLDLSTVGAFVDLHPFGGAFMLTAGVYFGDKTLDLTADPQSTYDIGGTTYTSAQVGTLAAHGELESSAPFVGLGWDTTYTGSGPWGFKFIAGVMFTGSPDIQLTSTGGSASSNPTFQQSLRQEEADLANDVDDFKVYPVVEAGVTFRF